MTIGFRIRNNTCKVGPETVGRFRSIPEVHVSDSMSRLSAAGARIRPMHRSGPLVGPAVMVRTRPCDKLMLHKAIDMATPGDVIVVDAGGDLTNSLMGELMLAHAIKRGVAGRAVVVMGPRPDGAEVTPQRLQGVPLRLDLTGGTEA